MRTSLVEIAHELLERPRRVIVGHLRDLVEPAQRRLEMLAALLFTELAKLAVRSQGRRRQGTALYEIRFRGLHGILRSLIHPLEQRSMGTHLVDSSHPLLIGRIVRVVRDLGDLSESPPRRLTPGPVLLLTHPEELPIRPQGRRGQLPAWRTNWLWFHRLILLLT